MGKGAGLKDPPLQGRRKRLPAGKLRGFEERTSTARGVSMQRLFRELVHLGNGPATMGPESMGSQARLQWAHWTSRAAASLAPEWVSSATEFFLRQ